MGSPMIRHQGFEPTPPKVLAALEEQLGAIQGSCEFSDFKQFKGRGSGRRLILPYKSVLKFAPKAFTDDPQATGDCTSHANRNATDISRAVEIDIKGEAEAWVARGATEFVYSFRGKTGQGMNPGQAMQTNIKYGLLLRQKYPFADLSKYNPNWGIQYGRSGPPQSARTEASKHPAKYYLRLRNINEACDAMASGFGFYGGSNYGNDGTRNAKGIATWNDSWNHAMASGGFDETGDDLLFLLLQSWGLWNSGGHPDWGPIPGGSFLIPSRDMERMITTGEYWAVGNIQGWPLQDLPDYGFSSYL